MIQSPNQFYKSMERLNLKGHKSLDDLIRYNFKQKEDPEQKYRPDLTIWDK